MTNPLPDQPSSKWVYFHQQKCRRFHPDPHNHGQSSIIGTTGSVGIVTIKDAKSLLEESFTGENQNLYSFQKTTLNRDVLHHRCQLLSSGVSSSISRRGLPRIISTSSVASEGRGTRRGRPRVAVGPYCKRKDHTLVTVFVIKFNPSIDNAGGRERSTSIKINHT